jgi:hypothetical protein
VLLCENSEPHGGGLGGAVRSACRWCAACSGHQYSDDIVKLGADRKKGKVEEETVVLWWWWVVVVVAWKKASSVEGEME